MSIDLEASWLHVLKGEFEKDYMVKLKAFLKHEKEAGYKIYPKGSDIFNAFNQTPFDEVKVVILGQDPYHGAGQAHGLSFSVQRGVRIPPSLQNIYKELVTDIPGFVTPNHGDLTEWAKQGVLLLNATLTVREGEANVHQNSGWGTFTDKVIQEISDKRDGVVFILWGSFAKSKAKFIDANKHTILSGVHPSPLSAHGGFFGSKPFSKTNEILAREGKQPIDWQIH
ncbi:uracil-DNA glycosylase [Mucilaginibacter sp. HMF5004]|uniref:uracil-DNA glycosylase n=1 Tax=Mucilaginibacter rivuli TaxID=2857527 RepID=UPI001C5E0C24|nr:uracil-DNA glycosylase [Mucilaginibacter rivuli]MBW4891318.1 uracil-DNA glycosylase [Mucilaginibacter rivuli]